MKMSTRALILAVALIAAQPVVGSAAPPETNGRVYVCPPCPATGDDEAVYEKPGVCPICGMSLVERPADAEAARTTALVSTKGKGGTGDLDGSFLKPYSNGWKMIVTKKDGTVLEAGTWTDELIAETRDARPAFRRTQVTSFTKRKDPSVGVNVFDAHTLAPISSESRGRDGELIRRTFHGRTVAESVSKGSAAEVKVEKSFEQPVVDFYGGMWGLLLAALPLREGYTTTLPAVGEFELKPEDVTAHVLRHESVEAGRRDRVEAWVVEAQTTQGVMMFWVSKESPYVIRLTMTDAQGNAWDFRML